MKYKKYITDATRTESKLEKLTANEDRLRAVLDIVISGNEMLDLMKKNIFYGKTIQMNDWVELCKKVTISTQSARDNAGREASVFGGPSDASKTTIDFDSRIAHSIIGISTEAGELLEAMRSSLDGEDFDVVNFGEEIGDIQWYTAIGIDAGNLDFDTILKVNIDKLKARFPDKFSNDKANNRDLDTERKILEDVKKPNTTKSTKSSNSSKDKTVTK